MKVSIREMRVLSVWMRRDVDPMGVVGELEVSEYGQSHRIDCETSMK
jgi:hypothetical protein